MMRSLEDFIVKLNPVYLIFVQGRNMATVVEDYFYVKGFPHGQDMPCESVLSSGYGT
jgi:hypothetical protein